MAKGSTDQNWSVLGPHKDKNLRKFSDTAVYECLDDEDSSLKRTNQCISEGKVDLLSRFFPKILETFSHAIHEHVIERVTWFDIPG